MTIFLRILETTGDLARRQGAERQPCLLAHYHRYLAVFDASNGRRALGYAEQAIRAGDRPADAQLVRGILLDKQGQRDRALEAFLKALKIDPRHAEAYRWATSIYSERGDLRSEYRIARAAFDAAPTDSFYVDHLDHVLSEQLGDPHGVIKVMQRAVEADPDNARAHDRLGHAWGFVGDQARSLSHYQQAIRFEPANAVLHEGLGRALHRLGRSDEAIAAYREAARFAPRLPAAHGAGERVSRRAALSRGHRRVRDGRAAGGAGHGYAGGSLRRLSRGPRAPARRRLRWTTMSVAAKPRLLWSWAGLPSVLLVVLPLAALGIQMRYRIRAGICPWFCRGSASR